MQTVLITGLLLLGFVPAPAQTLTANARAAALGFADTALEAATGFSANAAAPATLRTPTLTAGVGRPFGLAELQTAQVLYAGPLWRTHAALGVHTFGFSAYRELRLRAGLAGRVRPWLALGVHAEAHTVRVTGYGRAQALGLSVGGLLRPTATLHLGFQATNLNRPAWADTESLPRRLALGLAYRPAATAQVLLAVDKAVRFPASLRGGLQIQPVPALALRTGFTTAPQRFTAGFGLYLAGVRVDAAAVRHPYLGWTPVLSVQTAL